MKVKKIVYLVLFVLLGIILQGLIRMGLEIWYINLLLKDFECYGLGLSWSNWFVVHYVLTVIFAVLGIAFGLWQGFFWWRIIYIEKRLEKLKENFKDYLLKKKKYAKKRP
ncbi:MAG: hypothetical protein ACTSU7_11370 [Candidatus Heimdallarchaeaceae archaeon]